MDECFKKNIKYPFNFNMYLVVLGAFIAIRFYHIRKKFKTDDYKKCIVFMLPQEKATEILEKFGYYVDEQGNLKKDITWEEAQEISSKSPQKQEKKNKKQSAKQSKLTYKTNKNTGRK